MYCFTLAACWPLPCSIRSECFLEFHSVTYPFFNYYCLKKNIFIQCLNRTIILLFTLTYSVLKKAITLLSSLHWLWTWIFINHIFPPTLFRHSVSSQLSQNLNIYMQRIFSEGEWCLWNCFLANSYLVLSTRSICLFRISRGLYSSGYKYAF